MVVAVLLDLVPCVAKDLDVVPPGGVRDVHELQGVVLRQELGADLMGRVGRVRGR